MLHLLYVLLATARSSLKPQRELALENLALRQQLAVVQRKTKRPKLTKVDRAFWVALCRLWPDWQNALIIVKPQTVIGWHRKGFKLYWTWKSRKRTGRPPIDNEAHRFGTPRRPRHLVLTQGRLVFDPNVNKHHHFIDEETNRSYEIHDYQVLLRGKKRTTT
jgi:hypothetical protein